MGRMAAKRCSFIDCKTGETCLIQRRYLQKSEKQPRRHQGDAIPFRKMTDTTTDLKEFQLHDTDTGSADVQVARLTARINHLTDHLANNKKDFSSRRGLLKLVATRRKLLDYLARTENERYQKLLSALNLRR